MPLPKYVEVICLVFSGYLHFPLCQAITKSLYFCRKTSCREKSVTGVCVCILRALVFGGFSMQFSSIHTLQPFLKTRSNSISEKNIFTFFTKVNKMLAPEYSQQTLAPKLILI